MKKLLIVALVAAGGYLAYQYVPGLRTAVAGAKDKLTTWSEEDRKNDAPGYISYARGKLEDNIGEYETLMKEIADLSTENSAKVEEFARLEKGANDLLVRAREEFAAADAAGSWPIQFMEQSYTMDQLVDQVDTWMNEKAGYTRQVESYRKNLGIIGEREADLRTRVQSLRSAITDLDTKEATLKVAALSEADSALLAQVDDLLQDSTQALSGSPVRSVKDILAQEDAKAAEEDKAAAKTASRDAALSFLKSKS